MAPQGSDQLADMLREGWIVVGYSTAPMPLGGLIHSILMQRAADELAAVTIIKASGNKELGRVVEMLSPRYGL